VKRVFSIIALSLLWAANAPAQFLFKDVTASAGIFSRSSGVSEAGPGVVIFDLNGDGWDDIYMAGGFDSDKIFLNMRDGTFKDVTPANISTHTGFASSQIFPRGGIAFDYDNDGYPDLYLACQDRDILWHNNGDGTFTDMSKAAGLDFPLDQNESMSATFGDFNGDGLNDFYVARWIEEWKYQEDAFGHKIGYAHKGFPNYFYINNGNGTFTESAKKYGVDGDTSTTNIAIFFDYDRDGDLDILIGNDFGTELTPNQVWKNMLMETGEATFVNVSHEIGLLSHLSCMGIGPCDYNRDGHFDFYETTFGPDSLMKNNGDNTFRDASKTDLPSTDGYPPSGGSTITTTWTALLSDFDNDGWEDAFIVHGYLSLPTLWTSILTDTSEFYHNNGGRFEDITSQAMSGDYINVKGRGAAYLDFNHDGKLDICLGSLETDPASPRSDFMLYKNITENTNHWLEMRFSARRTAKEGIGTIVDVWTGGIVGTRQVSTGGGFGSQNSLMQHVGMGKYSTADSIIVYWPCDKYRHRQVDRYYNVPADHIYYIMENMGDKPDTNLISLKPIIPPSSVRTVSSGLMPVLYPNPVTNTLNVQNLDPIGIKHFEVYDLLGIKHIDITGTENVFSLSVANLKPACYVLRIGANGNTTTKQFIKE
jgi:hypothetical protein